MISAEQIWDAFRPREVEIDCRMPRQVHIETIGDYEVVLSVRSYSLSDLVNYQFEYPREPRNYALLTIQHDEGVVLMVHDPYTNVTKFGSKEHDENLLMKMLLVA